MSPGFRATYRISVSARTADSTVSRFIAKNLLWDGVGRIERLRPVVPGERQSESARRAWEEAERNGPAAAALEQFCLRDVAIMEHGPEGKSIRVPFLIVSCSAVNAFSPVLIST